MSITYFGIFNNGSTIEKQSLAEVLDVRDIEHIVKCSRSTAWANPPTFTILDTDGSRKRFAVGDFEVLDIGEESPGSLGGSKTVTIKENRTGNIIQHMMKTGGIKFLKDELIPFMNHLNECGSFSVYNRLYDLEANIKQLKDENKTLRRRLEGM